MRHIPAISHHIVAFAVAICARKGSKVSVGPLSARSIRSISKGSTAGAGARCDRDRAHMGTPTKYCCLPLGLKYMAGVNKSITNQ